MRTPIYDFVTEYANSDMVRFHMPGHKGKNFLGCESFDITEIGGADALYEASGIIAESEGYATELFGSGATLFSTEGSSQCIRAMLYLARLRFGASERPIVVAARNVHKAFIYAAVLLDFEIEWIWPKETENSICTCEVDPEEVQKVLKQCGKRAAAVYITSPNYLGGEADIAALARVCHENGTLLAVDNAHGAYLKFLKPSRHPMDLGADLCCDSAHKTFPVLTGGAYLHIGKSASEELKRNAKRAMELFGSTSPSYLIMASLDLCNQYLAGNYRECLSDAIRQIEKVRNELKKNGWQLEKTDPLRITIKAPSGLTGCELGEVLRRNNIEYEYADADFLVLMLTPENDKADFERLLSALGLNQRIYEEAKSHLQMERAVREMSVREAYLSEGEVRSVDEAAGEICRVPMATCPPAIPVVVPGERIGESAIRVFQYYGIDTVEVVKHLR